MPLSPPIWVMTKVFLQGPYDATAHAMRTGLRTSNVLSSHFGVVPIPVNAVDSISIEIRDSLSAAKSHVVKVTPAWLLKDGTLRAFTDTMKNHVEFAETAPGPYYIVVRHRNHLPVMSATAQTLSASSGLYDFTTTQTQAYGTNPMKGLEAGVFGMYAGNNDGDNLITVLDYNAVALHLFQAGYIVCDHDLSGMITVLDYNPVGLNLFRSSQVPAP